MEKIAPLQVKKNINFIKVAFHTLGCKVNFSETSTISREFTSSHYQVVSFTSFADLYVINTCSVTENADKELSVLVKKALKKNPNAFIAVIGCYAQLKPHEIASLDGVDLVLGATEKFQIIEYVQNLEKNKSTQIYSCEIEEANFYHTSYSINERSRAFLKIQDGCDYKCSYCTIPKARGISRSDSLLNVINNAQKIADSGLKEIVLTGVNIGDYGKGEFGNKKHRHTFLDLVKALENLKSVYRFRISSIEPNLLSEDIIKFIANSKRFVPHFHIPLQSGSDKILKSMKRRYLSSLYSEKIKQIRSLIPDACIGADVIVGYPSETDEDFLETYNYISGLEISYLHVFTYSERANTDAIKIKHKVDKLTQNKRSKMLRSLSIKKRRYFYESQLGKNHEVLFESENKKGYITGFTENYIRVRMPWDPILTDTLLKVKLDRIDEEGFVRIKN